MGTVKKEIDGTHPTYSQNPLIRSCFFCTDNHMHSENKNMSLFFVHLSLYALSCWSLLIVGITFPLHTRCQSNKHARTKPFGGVSSNFANSLWGDREAECFHFDVTNRYVFKNVYSSQMAHVLYDTEVNSPRNNIGQWFEIVMPKDDDYANYIDSKLVR